MLGLTTAWNLSSGTASRMGPICGADLSKDYSKPLRDFLVGHAAHEHVNIQCANPPQSIG